MRKSAESGPQTLLRLITGFLPLPLVWPEVEARSSHRLSSPGEGETAEIGDLRRAVGRQQDVPSFRSQWTIPRQWASTTTRANCSALCQAPAALVVVPGFTWCRFPALSRRLDRRCQESLADFGPETKVWCQVSRAQRGGQGPAPGA
jgi:hypothetical protein